ncbi:MAG: hypothetical protein IKB00_03845 [Bacteroidaceae bacterium]|nr:hypothetical protein [Bacteroidaceae bacterium]MBR6856681.1 hypothetical protein [Bacteroidaceae bacterium]
MKRIGKFMMIAAMAMVSYSASAELEPQWSKGTMMVNAAIGVQPFGGTVSLDYVLVDEWWKGHFTVGGEFDFSVPYKHETAIGITPRATYGLNITPEFEVHVTAETGFGIRSWQYWNGERDVKTTDSFILWGGFAGCRYFFTENLAVLAEIGGENWFPALRAGITYKF